MKFRLLLFLVSAILSVGVNSFVAPTPVAVSTRYLSGSSPTSGCRQHASSSALNVSASSPSSTSASSSAGDGDSILRENIPTLYDHLRLPSTASRTELKYAFIQLAKQFHPDSIRMMGKTATEADIARFRQIAEAWSVLSDLKSKRLYDLNMRFEQIDNYTTSREQWVQGSDCRYGCGIDDGDPSALKWL
mmetsp:Transcript_15332/g.33356  ORF Transcript_15332/g.33356 Transcript_15332/m.33356 type:complete len:190 (-) Transcript_15332:133-702(-)|eukprot:CAMPEP_0178578146 /NCGR_PEP_ID=MMETSP0697-20121206/21385_1 /TAXON_ID=265572 /ORGANISM="Extubocellulus spinifer, Strain CCMP396" /LENGTH=189 /DNA_ID=CAMNT_0020213491 /DNA_START=37 /DNA_END=606 /DNA_ORIENTATION=+